MAGIEKMTETILADARAEAESIIEAARKAADEEKQAANNAISLQRDQNSSGIEKELEDIRQRAESARDLTRRKMILSKKQEIIARIIEKVRMSMHDADTESYFSHLYSILERYSKGEEGSICLNANDLNRLPSDFAQKVDAIAQKKGGKLEVSAVPYDIEDGFLLIYGGTEENCSFRSLIDAQKDSLYDEINKALWRDN